jgi:hypothetical protein
MYWLGASTSNARKLDDVTKRLYSQARESYFAASIQPTAGSFLGTIIDDAEAEAIYSEESPD